jgi:hypothetical protein
MAPHARHAAPLTWHPENGKVFLDSDGGYFSIRFRCDARPGYAIVVGYRPVPGLYEGTFEIEQRAAFIQGPSAASAAGYITAPVPLPLIHGEDEARAQAVGCAAELAAKPSCPYAWDGEHAVYRYTEIAGTAVAVPCDLDGGGFA